MSLGAGPPGPPLSATVPSTMTSGSISASRSNPTTGQGTPSVTALAEKLAVETPIAAAVDAVLHRGMAIGRMIEQLLARPRGAE